jgi:UDP-glucose 4-epimerase
MRATTSGGGLVCNVGTGHETSINELLSTLAAVAGQDVVAVNEPVRPGEVRRSSLDVERAAIQLGWRPWTTLPDGIRALVEFLRDRPQ